MLLVSADDWLRGSLEVCPGRPAGRRRQVDRPLERDACRGRRGATFDGSWSSSTSGHDPTGADRVVRGGDGQTACRSWCCTTMPTSSVLTACLEAGAAGFQTKAIGVAELMPRSTPSAWARRWSRDGCSAACSAASSNASRRDDERHRALRPADPTRAGDPRADRPRRRPQRHRRHAGDQPADRADPHPEHPHQARGALAHRSGPASPTSTGTPPGRRPAMTTLTLTSRARPRSTACRSVVVDGTTAPSSWSARPGARRVPAQRHGTSPSGSSATAARRCAEMVGAASVAVRRDPADRRARRPRRPRAAAAGRPDRRHAAHGGRPHPR